MEQVADAEVDCEKESGDAGEAEEPVGEARSENGEDQDEGEAEGRA